MATVSLFEIMTRLETTKATAENIQRLSTECHNDHKLAQTIALAMLGPRKTISASDKSAAEIVQDAATGLREYVSVLESVINDTTVEWPPTPTRKER